MEHTNDAHLHHMKHAASLHTADVVSHHAILITIR